MSGIDEQIIEIPVCPVCDKRPPYWTVYVDGYAALWFYSKSYVEGKEEYMKNGFVGAGDGMKRRYVQGIPPEKLQRAVCMHTCHASIPLDYSVEVRDVLCKILRRDFPHNFKEFLSH